MSIWGQKQESRPQLCHVIFFILIQRNTKVEKIIMMNRTACILFHTDTVEYQGGKKKIFKKDEQNSQHTKKAFGHRQSCDTNVTLKYQVFIFPTDKNRARRKICSSFNHTDRSELFALLIYIIELFAVLLFGIICFSPFESQFPKPIF